MVFKKAHFDANSISSTEEELNEEGVNIRCTEVNIFLDCHYFLSDLFTSSGV